MAKVFCVNAGSEEIDYATLIPWLEEEYPDGWVIVKGRSCHLGLTMAALGLRENDELVPLVPSETPVLSGEDSCRYCKHERADHNMPASIACDHPMCVCFHFEEPLR